MNSFSIGSSLFLEIRRVNVIRKKSVGVKIYAKPCDVV